MSTLISISVLAFVAVVVVGWRMSDRVRHKRPLVALQALEREFLQLVAMPPEEARAMLDRHLVDLAQRYPGRSREWRLRKALEDLKRDRH